MVEALKKAGADFRFQRYPTMGHMGINDEVIQQARNFISETLAK
jgi:predicted esterase